jgi:hypothetical protein
MVLELHRRHSEGKIASAIERQTVKVPSDWFLWAAGGAILGSLLLKWRRRHPDANFVAHWASMFLLLGLYNKLVKLHGTQ